MIVLDEQLSNRRMRTAIQRWHAGKVVFIRELRPGTIIKDDAVPQILYRHSWPAFVTVNVGHFWKRVQIDNRYCVVCFDIPDLSLRGIPQALKLLFNHPDFKNKKQRSGHVFCVNTDGAVQFYGCDNAKIRRFRNERAFALHT
jgi:hypothetical protein